MSHSTAHDRTRRPAIVAHRGSWSQHRENTLPAFAAALAEGADMVELDVWLSADGVPVVHHDEHVGADVQPIGARTAAELAAGGDTSHIPTLDDVLAWAGRRIGVYIELKGPGTAEAVAALVRRRGMAGQVVVGSFEVDLVAATRAAAPELETSILSHATDLEALIALGRDLGVRYVHPCWKRACAHPHTLLPGAAVERVHDAGMGVVTWDEDRPEELKALLEAGPDGICTNLPADLARLRHDHGRETAT